MVVHLQSPFALIVGGVPHAYQGVSDDDVYVYQDMRWVHHKQFPRWQDALRHAARLK